MIKQKLHRLPCGQVMCVFAAVDVAAPRVIEMRKIKLLHPLLTHQGQQRREVMRVQCSHGVAQAHFDLSRMQMPHRGQTALERALESAKLVVRFTQTIQADADVIKINRRDAIGHRRINQRAIGRKAGVKPHGLGACSDFKNIGTQQRLTPREDEHRHAKVVQIVHHLKDLMRAQLACVVMIGRLRVAMLASEVAATDQIPDHHWTR